MTAKGKTIVTTEDLDYFANSLANERNFVRNLDKILIPRTVGSEGSRKVREVRRRRRRRSWALKWELRLTCFSSAHQWSDEEAWLEGGGAQFH